MGCAQPFLMANSVNLFYLDLGSWYRYYHLVYLAAVCPAPTLTKEGEMYNLVMSRQ